MVLRPFAVRGRPWTKNRENNPMQSRVDPGSQHSLLCCVRGRRKNPGQESNLTSSRSSDECPLLGVDRKWLAEGQTRRD